jgi:hypothetical protein
MDEKTILQYSKDLTLNYLDEIKAEVKEQDGIYYVTLPKSVAKLFGGETKKFTFSPEVAAAHSYELVVPGSNFLSLILREVQKQAPVVTGIIPKNEENMLQKVGEIESNKCQISLYEHIDNTKLGVRFYFHVNLKSIKNTSSIRWSDVDLDSLELLQFPFNLNLKEEKLELVQNDKKFEDAYSKSTEEFASEIKPQVEKYVGLTEQDKKQEITILDAKEKKSIQEIMDDWTDQKSKLKDFDRKITRAKNYDTRRRHAEDKTKYEKKLQKMEAENAKLIQKITKDKKLSLQHIEQKYKPSLDFSLLAAIVYSFNVTDCFLTVQKGDLKKQTKAQYIDPSSQFITNCEVCQNLNQVIHLCENAHISCENCTRNCLNCKKDFCMNCSTNLNSCYICKDGLCVDCSKNCEICSDNTCYSHSLSCNQCSKFLCYFCAEKCVFCADKFCINDVQKCHSCQDYSCNKDSEICAICSKNFCLNHQTSCPICQKPHCSADTKTCKICQMPYGSNCVPNQECSTCANLISTDRDNSQIREFITKNPQYEKHKKWKFGENNRYLILKTKKKLFGEKTIVVAKNSMKVLRSD